MRSVSGGRRILILGGTREARELAAALAEGGYDVTTSLAGVTSRPLRHAGALRLGGFGGAAGLIRYLAAERMEAVIDATHPFAARMSANAHRACRAQGIPLLRLERPPWRPADGDKWIAATGAQDAADLLPIGARALVTIGRQEIACFFLRSGLTGVARMIEAPPLPPPPGWTVLRERPPFSVDAEMALITHHAISHLVTKNAGGADTEAKIVAARRLGIPAIVINRPEKPSAPVHSTAEALIPSLRRALLP